MTGGDAKGRLRLELFPRAEMAVRAGHPWVYADSVKSQNREGETGDDRPRLVAGKGADVPRTAGRKRA